MIETSERESLARRAAEVAAAKIGEARTRASYFAEHHVGLCFSSWRPVVADDDQEEK